MLFQHKTRFRRQKKPLRGISTIMPFFAAAVFAVIALFGYVRIRTLLQADTIYPGITIDGIDVGGLTPNNALSLLRENYSETLVKNALSLIARKKITEFVN